MGGVGERYRKIGQEEGIEGGMEARNRGLKGEIEDDGKRWRKTKIVLEGTEIWTKKVRDRRTGPERRKRKICLKRRIEGGRR